MDARKSADRSQVLADIARQLRRLSIALEAYAREDSPGVTEHVEVGRSLLVDAARWLEEEALALKKVDEKTARRLEEKALAPEEVDEETAQRLEEEALAPEEVDEETVRLRKAVLKSLHQRGPALFPELAAVTLSLPDEIRPVLQAMEREGLVEIQRVQGWETVSLTARGRDAVREIEIE